MREKVYAPDRAQKMDGNKRIVEFGPISRGGPSRSAPLRSKSLEAPPGPVDIVWKASVDLPARIRLFLLGSFFSLMLLDRR